MQISNNTSTSKTRGLLIKAILILAIFFGAIVMLDKVDFPSPNKEIEKFISNENLKIVK
tara:strand:- start:306 stop:482 length:177 start_codon:yes stop_codon:yes gene_type:complete